MPHQVVQSAETRGRYQGLLVEARLRGVGPSFETPYRQIEEELRADGGVGEIVYWLPSGRPVFHRVSGNVSVHYALYVAERLVWVFRIDSTASREGSE